MCKQMTAINKKHITLIYWLDSLYTELCINVLSRHLENRKNAPISCVVTVCLRVLNVIYIARSDLPHTNSYSATVQSNFYASTYFGYAAEICRSVKFAMSCSWRKTCMCLCSCLSIRLQKVRKMIKCFYKFYIVSAYSYLLKCSNLVKIGKE